MLHPRDHSPQSLHISPLGFSRSHKQIDTRWVELKFVHNYLPRSYFAATIQAGNMYVHGGFNADKGIMKDFYVSCLYDQQLSWKLIQQKNLKTSPGPLRNHTMSSYLANLIVIGGQKNVIENNQQIYRFDLIQNIWIKCRCVDAKGTIFAYSLDSHSAIVVKNHIYIIGGYDANTTSYLQQIIKINLDEIDKNKLTYSIIKTEKSPSIRGNSSCCLVANQIFMFGGGKIEEVYDDFWIFDLQTQAWLQVNKEELTSSWPERRKGGSLVLHNQSNCLFLFGGISKITKEQNDVMVYLIKRKKWINIHKNTNQLYQPSPTVKQLAESPTIIEVKRNKQKKSAATSHGFRLGVKTVQVSQKKMNQTANFFNRQTPANTSLDFKKKMSVVQQKKYRQFLSRKKKLLKNIESQFKQQIHKQRNHSPTSQALIFSLNSLGEQSDKVSSQLNLPKVIFDGEKGQVIGKKPCARDGHTALIHEQNMIILGGDRHMVAFNDAYLFKLDKAVQTLPHYEEKK